MQAKFLQHPPTSPPAYKGKKKKKERKKYFVFLFSLFRSGDMGGSEIV